MQWPCGSHLMQMRWFCCGSWTTPRSPSRPPCSRMMKMLSSTRRAGLWWRHSGTQGHSYQVFPVCRLYSLSFQLDVLVDELQEKHYFDRNHNFADGSLFVLSIYLASSFFDWSSGLCSGDTSRTCTTSAGHGMETSWCLGLWTTLLWCGMSTKVCLARGWSLYPLLSVHLFSRFRHIPACTVKQVCCCFCVQDRSCASSMTTRATCRGWPGILWASISPLSAVTGKKKNRFWHTVPEPVCGS